MKEILASNNLETITPRDVFNINQATDTVIACIQGEHSSPKITKDLISRGYTNYRCLSGGLITLSDYFHDTNLSEQIERYFPYEFGLSLQQRIIRETGKSQFNYYRQLKDKNLYVITHKVFSILPDDIQYKLTDIGVKTIKYFQEERDFYSYFNS